MQGGCGQWLRIVLKAGITFEVWVLKRRMSLNVDSIFLGLVVSSFCKEASVFDVSGLKGYQAFKFSRLCGSLIQEMAEDAGR